MSPQRTDLVLTAHVPHCEADVLVLHGLHVEPNGGDGGHDLAQLQLVEDCCLTGSVQTWEGGKLCVKLFSGQRLGVSTHQPSGSSCPSSQIVV